MSIACVGWGSLIWEPRTLPVTGEWHADGPKLPLEFVRQSQDGRITLAIDFEAGSSVDTLWARLNVKDLEEARQVLADREGLPSTRRIGQWPSKNTDIVTNNIGQWAKARNLDGVVWTALPAKFKGEDMRAPTAKELVAYLQSLAPDVQARAEEYVRRTPAQIKTRFRQLLEERFGWTPVQA
jgi:hypothetical protein